MEYSHIIVRYGELTLKSGNRNEFLKKLTKNKLFIIVYVLNIAK